MPHRPQKPAPGAIGAPHKADFKGEFFDLQVGDKVVFELLNDTISGKRAQNVRVAPAKKR